MPKSKPPRRRYRPLRRTHDFERDMLTVFDKLEAATDRFERQVAPFLDKIPAKERAAWATQVATTRAEIAESRTAILKPSVTPVLDALIREDIERRRLDAGRG